MEKRIFVNRSLEMSKIGYIGFDMDATLAIYASPAMEELAFCLARDRLVEHYGYPQELKSLCYDASFATRSVWFDKVYGHFLKVDGHSTVISAWHGFKRLTSEEIRGFYHNKHVQHDKERMFILNTVFNTPEVYLLAGTIREMEKEHTGFKLLPSKKAFSSDTRELSFVDIFNDCRACIDHIHAEGGSFKSVVMANLDQYMVLDDRAKPTMQYLRDAGKRLFLLTNSDWKYTNALMTFVMGDAGWQQLFDVVIVDGSKPGWFGGEAAFKEVNTISGSYKLGNHTGPLLKGAVYAGGSVVEFRKLIGLEGTDTLYVGDHIFGDVLSSKRVGGWRTLLVVPELDKEMMVVAGQKKQFGMLVSLIAQPKDDHTPMRNRLITNLCEVMDEEYGSMGSLMRCGQRHTHFASTLRKYADLYSSNAYNLFEYPVDFYFDTPLTMLPHEIEDDSAKKTE